MPTPLPCTTSAAPPTHRVTVASDADEYRAECGCGWVSEWHFTPVEAHGAGAEHGAVTAALEHDLAAAAAWLVTHSGDDLGGHHRFGRVTIRIATAAPPGRAG